MAQGMEQIGQFVRIVDIVERFLKTAFHLTQAALATVSRPPFAAPFNGALYLAD
jgi:hypothetical protein